MAMKENSLFFFKKNECQYSQGCNKDIQKTVILTVYELASSAC